MANVTRGSGLLEGFLVKKRTSMANSLLRMAKKDRILDIGCGSFPYFLTSTDFKERYGIDPSLKDLNFRNLKLKKFDVTKDKLPFKDNFFEVVTMLAVFEHLDYDRLDFVMKEIERVLKNRGLLIITTPSPLGHKVLRVMAKMNLVSPEEIHEHKHHYNKDEIEEIIRGAGFGKNNVKSGFFEIGLNMWFTGRK